MLRLFAVFLFSFLLLGCDESKYNPGSLDNTGALGVNGPIVQLTSLEQMGVSIHDILKALHFLYLKDYEPGPILVPASVTNVVEEDEGSSDDESSDEGDEDSDDEIVENLEGYNDLSPSAQAVAKALFDEGCTVHSYFNDVMIDGEECPFSFSYYYGYRFLLHFNTKDEEIAEAIDVHDFSISGSRYHEFEAILTIDDDSSSSDDESSDEGSSDDESSDEDSEDEEGEYDALTLTFSASSYRFGTLTGEMESYRSIEGDEYSFGVLKNLNFDEFEADDFEENLDELCAGLFYALGTAEEFLAEQFPYDPMSSPFNNRVDQ